MLASISASAHPLSESVALLVICCQVIVSTFLSLSGCSTFYSENKPLSSLGIPQMGWFRIYSRLREVGSKIYLLKTGHVHMRACTHSPWESLNVMDVVSNVDAGSSEEAGNSSLLALRMEIRALGLRLEALVVLSLFCFLFNLSKAAGTSSCLFQGRIAHQSLNFLNIDQWPQPCSILYGKYQLGYLPLEWTFSS